MATATHDLPTPTLLNPLPPPYEKFDQCVEMIQNYWDENPDLYRIVQLRKQEAELTRQNTKNTPSQSTAADRKTDTLFNPPLRGAKLRAKMQESHKVIREHVSALNAEIVPRTQAHNRKSDLESLAEEQNFRSEVVGAQIKAWRSLLPTLIKKFSKIPDYRRPDSTKHKITVLLIFGLFAFIFRLSSRREMNREFTGPVIFEHLQALFPELDSIPHADTLARLLEKTNPKAIESIHISLIKDLIRKKKFKSMLIHDCLPITLDGTQKLYRDGLLQDDQWCEREVGKSAENKQQYIYAIEANITLKNGLTIPLMTEYLYRTNNVIEQAADKQDSETTAFERLAARLKSYFPRLKMLFFMDAMYATQQMMGIIDKNHWEYIISLPKAKLKDLAKMLNSAKSRQMSIPNQPAYRKRKQAFYWQNNIAYGYEWQLTIHLVGCFEEYESVDNKTGEIIKCYSEHTWISSILININNVHELLNLGARKKELLEDSINTEKNRGYHYKHAFSYNWNGMQGFHYLMRLAHAVNALSEFTKKLKAYIKALGCSAILKLCKETLFSPWVSVEWYKKHCFETAQLRLQLE